MKTYISYVFVYTVLTDSHGICVLYKAENHNHDIFVETKLVYCRLAKLSIFTIIIF